MNYKIGLCCHPATTVFVDDNINFIDSINLELNNVLNCKYFHDPVEALRFFKEDYQSRPFINRCFVEPEEEQSDNLFYQMDLRKIRNEAQIIDRFKEIAVVVIDYTMPGMNGFELSHNLRAINPFIRIILLTGEADHDVAVKLFNDEVIDKFIKKGSTDLINVLISTIRESEHNYFSRLSQTVFDNINKLSHKLTRLRDPVFVAFFNTLCKEKDVIEYYLVDDNGSFLLIDKVGDPHWLAVIDRDELHGYYVYAEIEQAPATVVEPLKNRQKIPFFYTEQDLNILPADWGKFLHPAQMLVGLDTYYYALISDKNAYQWNDEQIMPYVKYLSGSR